jgi:hypothetical protein
MALGITEPLTEMSTRNIPGGRARPAHKDDLTIISADCLESVGSTPSHNPIGLNGLLLLLLLYFFIYSNQSELMKYNSGVRLPFPT